MKVNTKDIALMSIFASLYGALVYIFAIVPFYALQFKIAGILRPAIGKKWILSIGYAIGVVIGNFFNPFAVPYELVFMPLVSLLAGLAGYIAAYKFNGNYFVAGAVIAVIVPIGTSWMLSQIVRVQMLATFPYLLISEQIVCFAGALLFRLIEIKFKWWE